MKIDRGTYLNLTGLLSIALSALIAYIVWPSGAANIRDLALPLFVLGPVFFVLALFFWMAFKWLGKFIYPEKSG